MTKKDNRRRRKNKDRQPQEEPVNMINTLRSEYDHLLASPFLAKKEDPGVPTIECTIGRRIFHKTCDIGSGVNIMSKVTNEYLFGNEPLFLTYMQLQMADESIKFREGIAKDVMVRIHDQYAPADFMVLDMGEEEDDMPIILGRPFLNTTNASRAAPAVEGATNAVRAVTPSMVGSSLSSSSSSSSDDWREFCELIHAVDEAH